MLLKGLIGWMRMAIPLSAVFLLSGCEKKTTINFPIIGPVNFLTLDNPAGDDDDPAVAVDAQGRVHVIWFSDRDGTKDLYTVQSNSIDLATGFINWTPARRLTDNDTTAFPPPMQGDNFPSLFIDAGGTFHLAWHRVDSNNAAHILYMQSDGTPSGWTAASEINITSGPNFDRFPNVVKFDADDLRIYFNSSTRATPGKNGIYMARSTDNGNSWAAPVEAASLNTAGEQSTFPKVVKVDDHEFIAALVRWKLEPSSDFLDVTSDIFYASSPDGDNWMAEPVSSDSNDVMNDLTPTFFFDHSGAAHLAWATIAFGDPAADIVQMRTADRAAYPDSVHTLSALVGTPDHSPEIIPIRVNGRNVYVMIWVRIATPPHNQVVYRVFSNL